MSGLVNKSREWWAKQPTWRRIKRSVPHSIIPSVWEAMKNDGVWIRLLTEGYQLYVGSYPITKKSLAQAWNINRNAASRIVEFALNQNDCGIDTGWEEP